MAALFATTQVATATNVNFESGIGKLNYAEGGFKGISTAGDRTTLSVDGNTYVNWETLNVLKGQTWNINGNGSETVLNTVNTGMSTFAGTVNSNVGKLIISNPNGMLFDGAKFTTAGDLILSTADLTGLRDSDLSKFSLDGIKNVGAIKIQNSDFTTGGDMTFTADTMQVLKSAFAAKNGNGNVKFSTTNGQDYKVSGCCKKEDISAMKMEAVNVNGNLYLLTNKGTVELLGGGDVTGNFVAELGGNSLINVHPDGKYLNVKGDMDVKAHGQEFYLWNTKVDGNLKVTNDSGLIELGSVHTKGNVNLKTENFDDINNKKYNHFVHLIGNNTVGGNLNIDSAQNIHIGGYVLDKDNRKIDYNGTEIYNGKLADGSLVVNGNLDAKTGAGHITTTVNVSAKNINLEANAGSDGSRLYGGNILSDGKSVMTADTYQFKADGYIGALKQKNESDLTVDNKIINMMESYTNIPVDTESHDYLTINGGTITKLETPGNAYIASKNDLTLTGANANDINLVAPDKFIHITGPNVHANNINIGGRTDKVQVDFPSRDFTLNYTNIRDGVVKTVKGTDEITYELTNDPEIGYNTGKEQTADTTFLVGPDKEVPPEPPVPPTPPQPTPNPVNPPIDEPERHLQWVPEDAMKAPVDTPVAFAADLDDDEDGTPIRKNVDGSVTVVRKVASY